AVKRVRPRLHRYAIRRLGDSHEAEELVQEALLRAYTHREQLLTEEDLSAWTTVVTGRLVIDRLRVRGRSTSVADVPEGTRVGRDTADVVVARDEARTALDALDAMPARQASLLWAREVEGHSYDELCVRFGMTEPAVRSVLTRARKALRKEYETRGGTLPVGGLAVLAPWITGLTLAHKLRKAATRITAPAALGAIGITALGGLVLSPFGLDPSTGGAHYSPTQAIVTSVSTRTDLPAHRIQLPAHAPAAAAALRVSAPATTAGTGSGALGTALQHRVENLCTTSSADQAGAGGSECTPAERNTWVYVPLPTSVAGQRQVGLDVGVKSGPHPVSCADLPTNPVIQCSSQGAQK
ncbi:MAG: putative polymerase ECF-type sigma factor, partial [Frankiales bacterium]|nr:putative polymerase ECF-type sigma factor [Frankiales bacterium]